LSPFCPPPLKIGDKSIKLDIYNFTKIIHKFIQRIKLNLIFAAFLIRKAMTKIVYSLVFNRKGQLSKDGKGVVSVCAYQKGGKRKYFTTEIKVKPEQWDKKRQQIKPTAPNYLEKNEYLKDLISKLEKFELDRIAEGETMSLDRLAQFFETQEETDFLAFFRKQTETNKTITENTRRVYQSTLKHLQGFRQTIAFDDINFKFIQDFENYLLGNGLNTNSTGKYLKILKAVVNTAINYGYMDLNKYPFRNFKIKAQASARTFLTPEEIERIENLQFDPKQNNLQRVRDMYLFAVYSGLRFSDIIRLQPSNIEEMDGKKWIVLNMEKTKEPLRLPIYLLFDGKPISLLEKYTDPKRRFYFDDFTNQFVNRELKEVARMAEIDKLVTFHTARHTTATYLLYKGVSLAVVQKILGHTKISTTQIYAKVMDKTTENELLRVFETK